MKTWTGILLSGLLLTAAAGAHAMTIVNAPAASGTSSSAEKTPLQGRIDAIELSAYKILIDGASYTYSPTSTIVMINGKRATIRELKAGDVVQFSSASSAPWPSLTSLNVLKP